MLPDEFDQRVARRGHDGIGPRQQERQHRDDGHGRSPAANRWAPARAGERAQKLETATGGLRERDHGSDGGKPDDKRRVEPARRRIARNQHGRRQQQQATRDDESAEGPIGGERRAGGESAGEPERSPDRGRRASIGNAAAERETCRRQQHPQCPVETQRGIEEDPGAEGGHRQSGDPEGEERRHRATTLSGMETTSRQRAEAALARVELADGGREVGRPEVRPHLLQEAELGVCALPEQEVAQPLLATRADEEIHVGCAGASVRRAQSVGESLAVETVHPATGRGSAEHHVARGVVDRKAQVEAAGPGGLRFGLGHRLAKGRRETVAAPDQGETHAPGREARGMTPQERAEERHEPVHLRARTLPVVR